MADDEVGGNNVKEGDANNSSNTCVYIIHQALIRTHYIWTYILVSVGYCWMVNCKQYSLITNGISGSGEGRTLMVGDQHHGSSSGPLCRCATPPVCISGGSKDDMPQLLLRSN